MGKNKSSYIYRLMALNNVQLPERLNKPLPASSREALRYEIINRGIISEKMFEDIYIECLGQHLISYDFSPNYGGVYIINYDNEKFAVFKGDVGYERCSTLTLYQEHDFY